MTNHVHLIATPQRENSLAKALGRTHNDYSRWLNVGRRESGHVWQNRFYSCPLERRHLWAALAYVERNPVRAGIVAEPGNWPWPLGDNALLELCEQQCGTPLRPQKRGPKPKAELDPLAPSVMQAANLELW